MASQAMANNSNPIDQRSHFGHKAQAATPRWIIQAPSKTQPAPAINHNCGGVEVTQPMRQANPHKAKVKSAPTHDHSEPMTFKRPHSQAPAAIMTTVNAMNGMGLDANNAGSNRANRTSAVMTLCLSMLSPEKKAAKGRPFRPWDATASFANSDRHDLLFFGSDQLVNLGHALVGQFLHIGFCTLLIVFGSEFVFDQLFDRFVGIAA